MGKKKNEPDGKASGTVAKMPPAVMKIPVIPRFRGVCPNC